MAFSGIIEKLAMRRESGCPKPLLICFADLITKHLKENFFLVLGRW